MIRQTKYLVINLALLISLYPTIATTDQETEKDLLINELIQEHGFDEQYVMNIFDNTKFLPELIESISKPAEKTKTWPELKLNNIMRAFFGLNDSVMRIKFLDRLPECYQTAKIDKRQFESLKNHIMSSFVDFQEIKKEDDYCEDGSYYRSKLKYNCINTCNNWVNTGLYKSKLTTRTWAPLSFNVKIKN